MPNQSPIKQHNNQLKLSNINKNIKLFLNKHLFKAFLKHNLLSSSNSFHSNKYIQLKDNK